MLNRKVSSNFVAKAYGIVQLKNHTEIVVIMEPSLCSLDVLLSNERYLGGYMLDKDKSRFDPVQIGSDVAEGLSVLHGKGYVHGDLAPSTVMVIHSISFGLKQLIIERLVTIVYVEFQWKRKPKRYPNCYG